MPAKIIMGDLLTVNEVFHSIQGEGTRAGLPCAFVRLTGCNLRCDWCDTRRAWHEGSQMPLEEVMEAVGRAPCRRVEVTGGEPLMQSGALALLSALCDAGYETLLETNGSMDISGVDERVVRIVDFKCPSSLMDAHNRWANVRLLTPRDEVKFVLADRGDFEYARQAIDEREILGRCPVIFSPVLNRLPPADLASWILDDPQLQEVRLGLQLHRIIWPDDEMGR